jgi:ABC-type amino acid transport substrate-binding protein
MLKPLLDLDKRAKHKEEVIIRALELTVPDFGSFDFKTVNVDMTPGRALSATKSGEIINLFIAAHNEIWIEGTIPIRIPIRQGLLSYRLLLVHKQSLDKFANVENIDDLKRLTAGVQSDWLITDIFKKLGFKLSINHHFEGLFHMLDKGRFDYFPRTVYEIYDELDRRKSRLQNVVIEPNLALYTPMETYVYVSPNAPRIAKRMNAGLSILLISGELKLILEKYYGEYIIKANLNKRKIIYVENPYLKSGQGVDEKYIWHDTSQN